MHIVIEEVCDRDNVRKGAKKKADFHNFYLCYVDNSLLSFVFNVVCLLVTSKQ